MLHHLKIECTVLLDIHSELNRNECLILHIPSYLNGLTLRYGKLYGNYRYITTKEFTEKQLQIAIARYVFISRRQRIQC